MNYNGRSRWGGDTHVIGALEDESDEPLSEANQVDQTANENSGRKEAWKRQ